jgi:hypothetical protein
MASDNGYSPTWIFEWNGMFRILQRASDPMDSLQRPNRRKIVTRFETWSFSFSEGHVHFEKLAKNYWRTAHKILIEEIQRKNNLENPDIDGSKQILKK